MKFLFFLAQAYPYQMVDLVQRQLSDPSLWTGVEFEAYVMAKKGGQIKPDQVRSILPMGAIWRTMYRYLAMRVDQRIAVSSYYAL